MPQTSSFRIFLIDVMSLRNNLLVVGMSVFPTICHRILFEVLNSQKRKKQNKERGKEDRQVCYKTLKYIYNHAFG